MGLIIDGVVASEAVDSSGEILRVEGCDISDLKSGKGVLNWEHRGDDANGASANDIIGLCVYAKKIYKMSDCEDERQRKYFKEVKEIPYIYGRFELFDDEDHLGAKSAAAIIRWHAKRNLPLLVRYSIEGSTLEKDGQVLKQSIARKVAATIKPANKSCFSGIYTPGGKDTKKDSPIEEQSKAAVPAKEQAEELDSKKDENGWLAQLKRERDPMAIPLGGAIEMEFNPEYDSTGYTQDENEQIAKSLMDGLEKLHKALEAGSYNAAPSTLVGGAALQVEDLGPRKSRVQVLNALKSAIRDWAGEGDLGKFIKMYMPEASDEFVDKFRDETKNWGLKQREALIAKAEGRQSDEKYQEELKGIKAGTTKVKGITSQLPPAETPEFKIKPSLAAGTKGGSFVDMENGILHTPGESFKLFAPSDELYNKGLVHPRVREVWEHAMDNWFGLHQLVKDRKLPESIPAFAGLFSAMSPNTSVPVQELAFAHLIDMMHKYKWDPRKRPPHDMMETLTNEWNAIVKGRRIPEYEGEWFSDPKSGIWTKAKQKINYTDPDSGKPITHKEWLALPNARRRAEGKHVEEVPSMPYKIGLGEQKLQGAMSYPDLHNIIWSMMNQGAGNRDIAARLNAIKHEIGKSKLRQKTAEGKGQEYTEEQPLEVDPETGEPIEVAGFAPKTIRFAGLMAGLGDALVPDTHLIRHLFGLHPKDPKNLRLKQILWNPANEHLLAQIDQWYYRNHPAVKAARKYFKQKYGKDIGQDAIGPGFWLHWLTIADHDAARGWPVRSHQSDANHNVYFNTTDRLLNNYDFLSHLRKSSLDPHRGSVPTRAAHAFKEMVDRMGYTPAMIFYFAHLVPHLLSADKDPQLVKAEILEQRLRKAAEESEAKEPNYSWFRDAAVVPGEIHVPFDNVTKPIWRNDLTPMKLLGVDNKFHHIEDETGARGVVRNEDIKKLAHAYRVTKLPIASKVDTTVNSDRHGIPGLAHSKEQRDLINGMDMSQREDFSFPGMTGGNQSKESAFRRGKSGRVGYMKAGYQPHDVLSYHPDDEFTPALREAAFHTLAKDFFGIGDHVPVTAAIRHPVTRDPLSVQEVVHDGEHVAHGSAAPRHQQSIQYLGNTGVLDKLALMDGIMYGWDRHDGNYLLTPTRYPYLHLIDNGYSFANNPARGNLPDYWRRYAENKVPRAKDASRLETPEELLGKLPLHPAAVKWLAKLDPKELERHMQKMGIPQRFRSEAVRRLQAMRERVSRGPVSKVQAFFAPHTVKY